MRAKEIFDHQSFFDKKQSVKIKLMQNVTNPITFSSLFKGKVNKKPSLLEQILLPPPPVFYDQMTSPFKSNYIPTLLYSVLKDLVVSEFINNASCM